MAHDASRHTRALFEEVMAHQEMRPNDAHAAARRGARIVFRAGESPIRVSNDSSRQDLSTRGRASGDNPMSSRIIPTRCHDRRVV